MCIFTVCVKVHVWDWGYVYGICEGTHVCVCAWVFLVCVRVYVCILLGHTREQLDNFGYHFLDAINSFF